MPMVEQGTKNEKILSFIVPVYNAEKYLRCCLDSLLEQDVPKEEYEILCINDGSKDGSLHILQEYAEKYENVIVIDKPNEGVSATRNLGIEKAQGEYIWFIDADDWIARNCLGYIFDIIKKHNVGVVQLQYDYIKAEWRVQQCQTYVAEKEKLQFEISNEPMKYISCLSSVIKRALFLKYDLYFFKHISYSEDTILMYTLFDCIRLGKDLGEIEENIAHCTGIIFYFYRQIENSAMDLRWTKNKEKYAQSLLDIARIAKNRMTQENYPQWYIEQYEEMFIKNIKVYMMDLLPLLSLDIKHILAELKKEGVYPVPKQLKIKKQKKDKTRSIKERIIDWYLRFAFSHAWFYPIYYKRLRKAYRKLHKAEGEQN